MTDYLHHVPGRLRLRARALYGDSGATRSLMRELRGLEGVRDVRLNRRAGSVTVHYDVSKTDGNRILDFINRHECLSGGVSSDTAPVAFRKSGANTAVKTGRGEKISHMLGKMALNVLVSRGVNYSISSLLGGRL